MARTPIEDRPPVAQWLIRARATQGDAYTADDFLSDLKAATGSAPNPATYRQWESGAVTPKEASLAPVLAYWADRGVAGPATAQPEASLELRAVLAAERAADAAVRQADALESILAFITSGMLPVDRAAVAASLALAQEHAQSRLREVAPEPDRA